MITSYHAHSHWSDGEGEIAEFFKAAASEGIAEVGMSDHYVLSRDGKHVEWSMRINEIDAYVEAVQSAACEAGENTIVRLGLEADFIPETADKLRRVLNSFPFDYVIGSAHFVDHYPVDSSDFWPTVSLDARDDVIRLYWTRVREMAKSGLFDIAAHLDITKKYGARPIGDISDVISDALDAIGSADMAVELNTSGWFAPCEEAYPERSILEACLQRDISVVITADAHTPANLTRGYDRASALLREIGFTETASFAGRQRFMHPLDD